MNLTSAETETAYRLILERTPSPDEIANAVSQHDRLSTLRQMLLNSEEFHAKFDAIRNGFLNKVTPVLVHLQIPEAVDPVLFAQLTDAQSLQPNTPADAETFAALCAKPRHERLKLRYVYGDLAAGAGAALRLPYMYLCTIARPGPRIFRLYRAACDAQSDATMSFESYLEYSLDSTPHRLELDNGQMRRLAGPPTADGFGQEKDLLAQALHNAFAPDMIFGFFEDIKAITDRLGKEGLVVAPSQGPLHAVGSSKANDTEDQTFSRALAGLGKDARMIFDAYTAWDNYLYEVCRALISPSGQ
jgi:hypothetical protein